MDSDKKIISPRWIVYAYSRRCAGVHKISVNDQAVLTGTALLWKSSLMNSLSKRSDSPLRKVHHIIAFIYYALIMFVRVHCSAMKAAAPRTRRSPSPPPTPPAATGTRTTTVSMDNPQIMSIFFLSFQFPSHSMPLRIHVVHGHHRHSSDASS